MTNQWRRYGGVSACGRRRREGDVAAIGGGVAIGVATSGQSGGSMLATTGINVIGSGPAARLPVAASASLAQPRKSLALASRELTAANRPAIC